MLEKLGYDVRIFESSENIRGIGAGIGLASNAIKAFEYLGLEKEIVSISNRIDDFDICDPKGNLLVSADTTKISKVYDQSNYAVHRADLHALLLQKVNLDRIQTSKMLVDLKVRKKVHLKFNDHSESEFDFIVGADGVNSMVRQILLPDSKPRYAGYWCWRAVVEVDNWKFSSKNTETWGKNGRFGISPLTKNRIYWYACVNSDLKDGIDKSGLFELKSRFKNYHSPIPELLELTKEEDLISTPIVDIRPIKRFHFEKILLIGDAAHATTPNLGQGACMAIEDVAVLNDLLQKNEMEIAFEKFEKRRMKRTHYISRTSKNAGDVSQSSNASFIYFRNNLLKILPDSVSQIQLKKLFHTDFMKL